MYGPAVRRKRFSSSCRFAVSHQCIRPHIGVVLRATMQMSAPAFSLPARPQVGPFGSQVSQAPGRPFLHLFSSSRPRPPQQKTQNENCRSQPWVGPPSRLAQRALVDWTRDCRPSSPASGRPGTRFQGRSMPLRLSTSRAASDRRKLTSARAVAASFALVAIPAE